MIRALTILSLLVGLAAIAAVYEIENRHDAARADVARLEAQIQAAERDIHVLEAEWSYLTRPAELERLTRRLLPMIPATPDHIAVDMSKLDDLLNQRRGVIEAAAEGEKP